MSTKLTPSSATAGFFQSPPVLVNQFEDDQVLRSIADTCLQGNLQQNARLQDELSALGARVVQPDIFALIADAERHPPTLSTHSTFGLPRTTLHTSHGWRQLQDIGIRIGIVASAYSQDADHNPPSRMRQFLKYQLWAGSSAMVVCPSAMTDGAATLLRRHLNDPGLEALQRKVFHEAYQRLTSFDPAYAWTSGQWMTERSGGSDVRGTETVASFVGHSSDSDAHGMPLGPWRVDGFKWFSSATDSQMTVLLAKTGEGRISAFLAPMRKKASDGSIVMNGISIQRLKPKLGTRALPTAELVLNDTRAWLIGKEGDGIREISAILNITRLHNAIGALGHWHRSLAISRAYARVRKVEGGLLQDNAMYLRTIARNTVSYAAHTQLGFFVVKLLDDVEQSQRAKTASSTAEQSAALLRLLTPVAKAQCSKMAIHGIQECMESLGGVGYIEDEQDFNIARLFRDCCVLSIWEGTTDVMANDVVRVLKGRTGAASLRTFQDWVRASMDALPASEWQHARSKITQAQAQLDDLAGLDAAALRTCGRELLELLAWITACVLLVRTAVERRGVVTQTVAEYWLARRTGSEPPPPLDVRAVFDRDRAVAFGLEQVKAHKL